RAAFGTARGRGGARMRTSRRLALGFVALVVVTAASSHGHPGHAGPAGAEPPYQIIDARPTPLGGRILAVAAGGDLQAVLDGARGGDTIVLPAGSTFRGPLSLPGRAGERSTELRTGGAA